jgi:hypothetical protein
MSLVAVAWTHAIGLSPAEAELLFATARAPQETARDSSARIHPSTSRAGATYV